MDTPVAPLADDLEAIAAAARDLGVVPDDPAYPFVSGLTRVLDRFGHRLDAFEARPPVDPAAMAKIEQALVAGLMSRTKEWAAKMAAEQAREQARAHWRRDLALVFGLVLAIGVAAGAAYQAGWSQGLAAAHETEAGLSAAFRGGHADAAAWLKLMKWNDADAALAHCTVQRISAQGGRKACSVPLWIEPPKSSQPNG